MDMHTCISKEHLLWKIQITLHCEASVYNRDVIQIFAPLSSLLLGILTLEDGADTLCRNVGDKPTSFALQQTPSVLPTTFRDVWKQILEATVIFRNRVSFTETGDLQK